MAVKSVEEVVPVVNPRSKVCTKCGGDPQPLGNFYSNCKARDGHSSWCKNCTIVEQRIRRSSDPPDVKAARKARYRAWKLKNSATERQRSARYMHNTDFSAIWEAQKGLCALCDQPMDPKGQRALSAAMDHDHACCPGEKSCGSCVRGLIHQRCNRLLGSAQDSIEVLEAAIRYLKARTRHA
jgi:hypothetical protein